MLYVLCGIPGSGKTTYAQRLANELGATLYSYDEQPDANRLGKLVSSHMEMWRHITNDLRNGKVVVCDDINTTKRQRLEVLSAFNNIECKKVLIVMNTPLNVCIERNENRPNRLPKCTITAINKTYEAPSLDEGWDQIIYNNGKEQ